MISNYVQSISILNRLNQNVNLQSKWMRHISTGMRVAGVADDPSGWAIGQRMSVRLRSLDRAIQNAQSHSSMLKVAEGAGQSSLDVLRMLKEKAIEAASDTATDEDQKNLQKYFDQFADQIDDNASVTYNGMALLDGSKSGAAQPTAQVYTNGSLGAGTTAATKLTDLSRRDGTALHIRSDDTITVSYVKDGKTVQTAYQVAIRPSGIYSTGQMPARRMGSTPPIFARRRRSAQILSVMWSIRRMGKMRFPSRGRRRARNRR